MPLKKLAVAAGESGPRRGAGEAREAGPGPRVEEDRTWGAAREAGPGPRAEEGRAGEARGTGPGPRAEEDARGVRGDEGRGEERLGFARSWRRTGGVGCRSNTGAPSAVGICQPGVNPTARPGPCVARVCGGGSGCVPRACGGGGCVPHDCGGGGPCVPRVCGGGVGCACVPCVCGGGGPCVACVCGVGGACVPRVCGGRGACAGRCVPLGAVLALPWCGEMSRGGKHTIGEEVSAAAVAEIPVGATVAMPMEVAEAVPMGAVASVPVGRVNPTAIPAGDSRRTRHLGLERSLSQAEMVIVSFAVRDVGLADPDCLDEVNAGLSDPDTGLESDFPSLAVRDACPADPECLEEVDAGLSDPETGLESDVSPSAIRDVGPADPECLEEVDPGLGAPDTGLATGPASRVDPLDRGLGVPETGCDSDRETGSTLGLNSDLNPAPDSAPNSHCGSHIESEIGLDTEGENSSNPLKLTPALWPRDVPATPNAPPPRDISATPSPSRDISSSWPPSCISASDVAPNTSGISTPSLLGLPLGLTPTSPRGICSSRSPPSGISAPCPSSSSSLSRSAPNPSGISATLEPPSGISASAPARTPDTARGRWGPAADTARGDWGAPPTPPAVFSPALPNSRRACDVAGRACGKTGESAYYSLYTIGLTRRYSLCYAEPIEN